MSSARSTYKTLKTFGVVLAVIFSCIGCGPQKSSTTAYTSNTLKIERINDHVYKHITFLTVPHFGKVACNGLVMIDKGEAIVFDTPTTDFVSRELIDWIEKKQKSTVKAVVINHFHNDCLGGLKAFHEKGAASYASDRTIQLAKDNNEVPPKHGFDQRLELKAGEVLSITAFYGEAHTTDNVVSYLPGEQVLFGGCLVKSIGAGKGNLADANVEAWPITAQTIKDSLPHLKIVVPGHGKNGGTDLLDYTVKLFSQ